MISVYSNKSAKPSAADGPQPSPIAFRSVGPAEEIPPDAIWIDLLDPTEEEDRKVELRFDIEVPTHSDFNYVEPTEALYAEKGARYLTAQIIPDADGQASLARVTFILTGTSIISVRYQRSEAFALFSRRLADSDAETVQPETILAGLINTIVDCIAHNIEKTDQSLEAVSTSVFGINEAAENHNALFKKILQALGDQSRRISNVRKSLVSLERVLLFLMPEYKSSRVPAQLRDDVRATLRDLQSLEEHATFQSQKVQFLLDTTLGLINLEQSHIIKLFSVLAVIFMPPTVIASIYGMNFKYMPELDWKFGYPLALVLMVASSVLLYMYFRWKHWL
jgi:magnesium transporter